MQKLDRWTVNDGDFEFINKVELDGGTLRISPGRLRRTASISLTVLAVASVSQFLFMYFAVKPSQPTANFSFIFPSIYAISLLLLVLPVYALFHHNPGSNPVLLLVLMAGVWPFVVFFSDALFMLYAPCVANTVLLADIYDRYGELKRYRKEHT